MQLIVTGFDSNGISELGLKVLKGAWKYVNKHRQAELHTLPLDEFCDLAGVPRMAAPRLRELLREAQCVVVWLEGHDTEAGSDIAFAFSSPLFEIAHAVEDVVHLQAIAKALNANVLPDVQSLQLIRRS